MGVIVLSLSVSVSVCLTLMAERTDTLNWILACRSSGRISRSNSNVKVIGQKSRSPGQKTFFYEMSSSYYKLDCLSSEMCRFLCAVEEATQEHDCKAYDAGRTQSKCVFYIPWYWTRTIISFGPTPEQLLLYLAYYFTSALLLSRGSSK